MKKILILLTLSLFAISAFSQNRIIICKKDCNSVIPALPCELCSDADVDATTPFVLYSVTLMGSTLVFSTPYELTGGMFPMGAVAEIQANWSGITASVRPSLGDEGFGLELTSSSCSVNLNGLYMTLGLQTIGSFSGMNATNGTFGAPYSVTPYVVSGTTYNAAVDVTFRAGCGL